MRGCIAAVVAALGCAQAQIITTVAGTDFPFPPTPIAAINAPTGTIAAVDVDSAGNVYVASNIIGNNLVFKVNPQGVLTVAAGNGTQGFSGDGGAATSAAFLSPGGVAVDAAGNLYIVDSGNQRIRKVTPAGIITTVAGTGTRGYSGDGGPATSAAFNFSNYGGLAVDASGDLFIADQGNNRIRELTPDGIIHTVAGSGTQGYSGDGGRATSAALGINSNTYVGIAVDTAGSLLIADSLNNRIRKVTSSGIITTVAGSGTAGYSGDGGPATGAALDSPTSVAVDAGGNIFIADEFNVRIRKVTPGGTISTVAGGQFGYSGDGGPATSASVSLLTGVAVDANDNLFIADSDNNRVRKVTPTGVISTFVGNGSFRFAGDGGPASSAAFYYPRGMALDLSGNLYIADSYNDRIRKVTPNGIISTVAGNGTGDNSGDGGPATQAGLLYPSAVAVDASGDLFIADTDHDRVRKVTPAGIISTVAGSGFVGYTGDGGPAISAGLYGPIGLATDGAGNLFIADNQNNVIRKVTSGGIISTVAGNGSQGYSGDGGPAVNAALNLPTGVAADASGNLFIADSGNDRIRKVTPSGTISTVAGNGTVGYSGDGGSATSAALALYLGDTVPDNQIAVDAAGNLFIADFYNLRVRVVTPGGIISTFAGNGTFAESGDGGTAINAGLYAPIAVVVDSTGNLFISDDLSGRIREVLTSAPAASVSPQQLFFTAPSDGAPTQPLTLSLTSSVEGLAFTASVPNGVNWLQLNPSSGDSPRLIQATADPTGLTPNTYQTSITINTPNAKPTSTTVAVTFTITAATAPVLSIDKQSLSFPFPQQGSARSQTITVSNTGSGALQFTATAATNGGGNWLSASPANGQALPGSPVALTVTSNPSGLSPGAYSGQVTVAAGAQSQTVAVTMTISKLNQAILLSQSGLSFLAVQSGGVVPAQSFGVMNIGTGVVNWTASTSTLAGGPGWLQVTPASGSSDAAAATSPRVTVSVNGSALPAGTYYGLVRVDAPGAANTPQVLTVFLQVLPSNANVAPAVQPPQLVFTTTAGGESPGSQLIQVYNIVPAAKSFQSQLGADPGLSLVTLPQDATLDPQVPTSIVVQPITTGLSAGVYNGAVTLQFSDGTVSAVKVSVIVSNTTTGTSASRETASDRPKAGTSCTPSKLLPALTTLGQAFTISAGWPTALIVNVKDDCGMPMPATGSVMVSFSNGDPALLLESQGGGSFENTWSTGNSTTGVTLTILANSQGIKGMAEVSGNLASQEQPPAFDKSGIGSVATAVPFTALAPGAAISIFGSRLAESTAQFQALPLPPQLVDTQVFVSGSAPGGVSTGLLNLPLYYVSQNQVNAVIPYEVSVDTTLQLIVKRGNTYSAPVQIDMAQAQPAVFSINGTPGSAGLIQVYPAKGGQPYFASASAPAHAGDTIVLYCTGLGAVNPAATDGAAPGQLSSTESTPLLTIGGQSAPVSFAGLTPGFVGLYQVNVVVPASTQTGADVAVTLSIDGQKSPLTTIAIQ